MGGPMQPQGHVQVWRASSITPEPPGGLDGPRFLALGSGSTKVAARGVFRRPTLDELVRRAIILVTTDDYNQFGSCQRSGAPNDGYLCAVTLLSAMA